MRTQWKFIGEAYAGTAGFLDGEELTKHTRESNDKLTARKDLAYYANIFETKVDRYIGYLYKKRPARNVNNNDILKSFLNNCNGKGTHLDIFMDTFSRQTKARGVGVILVDNVSNIPATKSDQIKNRAFPYITYIQPEDITNYKLDTFGNFEFFAFSDSKDDSTYASKKITRVTRYFDAEKWVIYENDKILSQGTHNLGICPVVYFSEKGDFQSTGEFSKLAQLSKRHYNLYSEQDELLRSSTFSLLAIEGDVTNDIKISTDNALFYKGGKAPSYISPSSSPATVYQDKIDNIEYIMDRIAYDVSTSRSAESGISLDIKFQSLNSSLSTYAMKMEDFEKQFFDLVCLYLKIENQTLISYAKDFNILDISKEIENLSMLENLATSGTYREIKLAQIIKSDLANVSDEDFAIILAEIQDNNKKEEEEI